MAPGTRSSVGGRSCPRKSHRKSRLGCRNCKQRRIKCDEQKPSCTNCTKHSILCDYNTHAGPTAPRPLASRPITPATTSTSTPTEQPPTTSSGPPTPFPGTPNSSTPLYTIAELELLHNYYTSTAATLASSNHPALTHFWRADVPQLSFRWPCLLHGIFSLSALHLARFRPSHHHHDYLAQADAHWQRALRCATPLLESIDDANCHAVYVFSILAAFYLLAKGPGTAAADDDDFAFDDIAGPLLHIRSTRTVIESASSAALRTGPAAVLFDVGIRRVAQSGWWPSSPPPPANTGAPDPQTEHALVQELRCILTYLSPDPSSATAGGVYAAEIDNLARSYRGVAAERSGSGGGGGGGGGVSTQVVFVWLYRLSDEFVECLRRREPAALTVFAFFVVLLKELDGAWYMRGWVDRLMAGIYRALSPGTRAWIRAPMERVGWIPPPV